MAESSTLTFKDGGWVLVLAGLVGLLFFFSVVSSALSGRQRHPALGDGRTIASYGFDWRGSLLPPERIVSAGVPKEHLAALDEPPHFSAADVEALRERTRIKYLVSNDLVIGVEIGGETRAYPLRVLVWHEVINDLLGGVPIAVTYHALCDSSFVFDRRVGGQTRRFAMSGLLYNSNLLLYDRGATLADESLWSQLQWRAIAGPAARAGLTLEPLPITVIDWNRWKTQHPNTTVVQPKEDLLERYNSDPYSSYFGSDLLRFPVDPLPADQTIGLKARQVVVKDPRGMIHACQERDAECQTGGTSVGRVLHFAWFATHPFETRR